MEAMIGFVDACRDDYGVEPICKAIAIAPSTYHAHVSRRQKPETASARVRRDAELSVEIKRVFDANFQVYGVRKVWRQLLCEGHDAARCTVARLMKKEALQGVIRGGRIRTTVSDRAAACPLDHVNRRFRALRPNVLCVSDFTCVATWQGFAQYVSIQWRGLEAVEYAKLEWVDWFNNRRSLEPIGNVPRAEAEAAYYAALEKPAKLAA